MATKRERRPGVWEMRVYVGRNPHTGAPVLASRTFHGTAKEADLALAAFTLEMSERREGVADIRTVKQLASAWIRHLGDIGRAGNTIEGYQSKLDNHLLPALGSKPLADLTALHLDRLYGEMNRSGLVRSIPGVHAVVRSMLSQAVKWDLVARNVAKQATLPTVAPLAPWAPPEETVNGFLEAVAERDEDLAAYLLLTADLGARRGEPLALRWTDVDWEKAEVNVARSIEHTKAMRKAGEHPREKPTKTHASGPIPVGPDTLTALEGVRARQREAATKIGFVPRADVFVFADLDRGLGDVPWRPDRVTRAVRRLRGRPEVAGLPEVEKVTVRSLRHFMVSSLAVRGKLAQAMQRARHRNISTTQRYMAVVESRKREGAEVMAEVLSLRPRSLSADAAVDGADGP